MQQRRRTSRSPPRPAPCSPTHSLRISRSSCVWTRVAPSLTTRQTPPPGRRSSERPPNGRPLVFIEDSRLPHAQCDRWCGEPARSASLKWYPANAPPSNGTAGPRNEGSFERGDRGQVLASSRSSSLGHVSAEDPDDQGSQPSGAQGLEYTRSDREELMSSGAGRGPVVSAVLPRVDQAVPNRMSKRGSRSRAVRSISRSTAPGRGCGQRLVSTIRVPAPHVRRGHRRPVVAGRQCEWAGSWPKVCDRWTHPPSPARSARCPIRCR